VIKIRLDVIGMSIAGVVDHPQIVIRKWFPRSYNHVPQSVCDAWFFNDDGPMPEVLPGYFAVVGTGKAEP
jgi:hypothetical protein